MATAQNATGTALTFTGFTGDIADFSVAFDRAEIDVTALGSTGGKEFIPGDLLDMTYTFNGSFKATEAPPVTGAAATLTITWGDGGTVSQSAFLKSFEITGASEEKIGYSAVFRGSGTVTITPDS